MRNLVSRSIRLQRFVHTWYVTHDLRFSPRHQGCDVAQFVGWLKCLKEKTLPHIQGRKVSFNLMIEVTPKRCYIPTYRMHDFIPQNTVIFILYYIILYYITLYYIITFIYVWRYSLFNYSVNNYHAMKDALPAASPKTRTNPVPRTWYMWVQKQIKLSQKIWCLSSAVVAI